LLPLVVSLLSQLSFFSVEKSIRGVEMTDINQDIKAMLKNKSSLSRRNRRENINSGTFSTQKKSDTKGDTQKLMLVKTGLEIATTETKIL
jgi:hypothetical protein